MSPLIISLLQIIVPAVLEYGPKAVADVQSLFSKQEPTADDWEALRAHAKPYEAYNIPASSKDEAAAPATPSATS